MTKELTELIEEITHSRDSYPLGSADYIFLNKELEISKNVYEIVTGEIYK